MLINLKKKNNKENYYFGLARNLRHYPVVYKHEY